jgi:hypothetical protein
MNPALHASRLASPCRLPEACAHSPVVSRRQRGAVARWLGLAMLCTSGMAMGQTVSIAPASRVESMSSPASGLPDQQYQHMNLRVPLTASLITVANLGGTGNRSFLLIVRLATGGEFVFSAKEGGDDITLALAQPVPVSGLSVRCDSFSATHCKYSVSVVGN